MEPQQQKKLSVKIKFPFQYPYDFKIVQLHPNFTVQETISYVILSLGLENYRKAGTVGRLFEPDRGMYLDHWETMGNYTKYLKNVDHLELREEDIVDSLYRKPFSPFNRSLSSPSLNRYKAPPTPVTPRIYDQSDIQNLNSKLQELLDMERSENGSDGTSTPKNDHDRDKRPRSKTPPPGINSLDLKSMSAYKLGEPRQTEGDDDQPGTPPSSPSGRAQNLHDHLEYLGSPSARRLLEDEDSGPDTARKIYWLTKLLEEKERDANLAAEIGKALLLKNEELLNEIENIKRKVEETEEKLRNTEDIRVQNERLQTRNMILHGEVQEAGKMNQTLLDELKEKEATIKDLQTSVNALKRGPDVDGLETMQELKERLEEYKLYLQQAKDTIEHLENTNSSLQETNTTLESEKENLAEEVYTLKRQLNDLEDLNETIKALKKKNKQLEAQLREATSKGRGSGLNDDDDSNLTDMIERSLSDVNPADNYRVLDDARRLIDELQTDVKDKDTSTNQNTEKVLATSLLAKIEGESGSTTPRKNVNLLLAAVVSYQRQQKLQSKLNKFFEENKELQDEIRALKGELDKQQQKSIKIQDIRENINNENEDLKSKMDEMARDMAQLKENLKQYDDLKASQQSSADELNSLNALLAEQKTRVEQAQKELNEKDDRIKLLQEEVSASKETAAKELETLREELKAAKTQLEGDIQALNVQLEQERAKNTQLEAKVHDFEGQVQQLQTELEQRTKKIAELEQEHTSNSEKLKQLQASLDSEISLREERQKAYSELETAKGVIESENSALKDQLDAANKKADELHKQIDEHKTRNDELSTQLASAVKERDELQKDLQRLTEENTQLRSGVSGMTQLQEELNQLKAREAELSGQLTNAQAKIEEQSRLNTKLTGELEALRLSSSEEKQQLEKQYKEMLEAKEHLISENEKTYRTSLAAKDEELEGVKKNLNSKTELEQQLRDELESLKKEVSSRDSSSDELKGQLANKNEELDRLEKLRKELESEKSSANERVTQLEGQLDEAKRNLQAKGDEESRYAGKLSQLESELKDKQALIEKQSLFEQEVKARMSELEKEVEAKQKLTEQLKQFEADKAKLVESNTLLQSNMNDLSKTNTKLLADLQEKDKIIQQQQVRIAELEKENASLRAELDKLKGKMDDKTKKFDTQMSDLASRLAQTQQQLELKKIREEEEIVLPTTFYSPEEKAMALYINDMLKDDKDVQHLLPIYKATPNMLVALKSGLLICKLINLAKQGTIDDRVLNTRADLSEAEIIQNYNLCLNSAPAIGCKVFHIQIEDLLEDKPTAFLDLAWEVIKVGLLSKVSIQKHPEIIRLFDNSQLEELQTVPGEQILLRWINYHLSGGKVSAEPITPRGSERGVKNFGRDLANVEAYVGLMCKLDAEKYNVSMLQEPDTHKRAEQLADVLKTQFRPWVTPKDINMGNERLNLAMMATIFDVVTGLEPIKEAEALVVKAALEIKDVEGSREERAFCTWINSLGIDRFVNNLHEDVSDGLVLLQMFDKISPGVVDWSRVNQRPTNRFMKNENCNMCVTLGKKLGFVLVGIEGKDFVDKNRKLILALVWQACKYHLLHILKTIGNTNYVDETTIKNWANQTIRAANKKSKEIDNFKDETISTGEFLIDLLDSCEPGVVNYELVTAGSNADEKALNAKYIISIARKIGCFIFLVWEDIVEVKANMILTFLASLMKFNQDRARRTK